MQGEVGMKIKLIELIQFKNENNYDMRLTDVNGDCFHIVGDNDLKSLLEDALVSIIKWK